MAQSPIVKISEDYSGVSFIWNSYVALRRDRRLWTALETLYTLLQ